MARFTIVFDACVLYPAKLCDLLVELANADLFQAKWTEQIHEEWIRNLLEKRPDITRQQLLRRKDLMDKAVMDCLVSDYAHHIDTIELPDIDDRHVVAAAIHARANAIVTYNLKDFPGNILRKYALEAIHPDDFLTYQMDLSEAAVLIATQNCRRRLKNPPLTAENYLDGLRSLGLPKTVNRLRPFQKILR
ncbi:MAG: PIN domain-containing protein [Alphaproteobacteria bacterium]